MHFSVVTRRRRLLSAAAVAVCAVGLFLAYVRMSSAVWDNSDGASNALQAWDMLHGNVLLTGWTLTDVSFYTTDLLIYVLVEAVHGLNADTIHIAAALVYTLVLLISCAVAKAGTSGTEALGRVGVVLLILIAPQPGIATGVLLLSPDHFGTSIALLLVFLLIDRRGAKRLTPVLVGLGLAWSIVADATVLYLGALPIAVVFGLRALRRRAPLGEDARLALAAVLSVPLADAAEAALRAAHGYNAFKADTTTAPSSVWAGNVGKSAQSLLLLYGIDLASPPHGWALAEWIVRAAGLAALLLALVLAARSALRATERVGPVDQVIALAVVVNLAAFSVSLMAGTGVLSREISDCLPLGAVLAGRVVGPLLGAFPALWAAWGGARRRAGQAGLAVGCAALAGLFALGLTQSSGTPATERLAALLERHGLHDGAASYWAASVTTVETGGALRVRPVILRGAAAEPSDWNYDSSWYDSGSPGGSDGPSGSGSPGGSGNPGGSGSSGGPEEFVVVDASDPQGVTVDDALRLYGRPEIEYRDDGWTVLVYDRDILGSVHVP